MAGRGLAGPRGLTAARGAGPSHPRKKTRFFPQAATAKGHRSAITFRKALPSASPVTLVPMRLLVVEDEPKMLEFLRKGLTESGFVVDTACDGAEGLHLATTGEYELVVLDI